MEDLLCCRTVHVSSFQFTVSKMQNLFFYFSRSFSGLSFVCDLDPWSLSHTPFPAPHPSRRSLSTEETPGPRRGAHVQLLLFLRPSVLVMECSPNISLTSAETLPRAFAVVLTQGRTTTVLSHGVLSCTVELRCRSSWRAISCVQQVAGLWGGSSDPGGFWRPFVPHFNAASLHAVTVTIQLVSVSWGLLCFCSITANFQLCNVFRDGLFLHLWVTVLNNLRTSIDSRVSIADCCLSPKLQPQSDPTALPTSTLGQIKFLALSFSFSHRPSSVLQLLTERA